MTGATEKILELSDPVPQLLDDSWILIFGGVSRLGNRRARRFTTGALEARKHVVWIDGFEEEHDRPEGGRVPLEIGSGGCSVFVLRYRSQERGLWVNRLATAIPRAIFAPGSKIAEILGRSKHEKVAHFGRRIRRVTRRVGTAARSRFLARFASAFRGRGGYAILKPKLQEMAQLSRPSEIVFCDDFALTAAWHAARQWPDVRVSSELSEPSS